MQRMFFVLGLLSCLFILPSGTLHAQQKTEATKPLHLAMLYMKLSRQIPDFRDWIEKSPAYLQADHMARADMMLNNLPDMTKTYKLLTPREPIVLEAQTTLGAYQPLRQRFFAPMLNSETFFNYVYLGQNYALVPQGIEAYQWLYMPAHIADALARETDPERNVNIRLYMTPLTAHKKPVYIGRQPFYPMMATVRALEIWSQDGQRMIWDSRRMMPARDGIYIAPKQ